MNAASAVRQDREFLRTDRIAISTDTALAEYTAKPMSLPEPYIVSAYPQQNFQPRLSVPRREHMLQAHPVLKVVQEWEGTVLEVHLDRFYASIYRKVDGALIREAMWFDFADESLGDKDLIVPGGIFRWLIGYSVEHGTSERASRLIFRRLPAYTKYDAAAAADLTDKIASMLSLEER